MCSAGRKAHPGRGVDAVEMPVVGAAVGADRVHEWLDARSPGEDYHERRVPARVPEIPQHMILCTQVSHAMRSTWSQT